MGLIKSAFKWVAIVSAIMVAVFFGILLGDQVYKHINKATPAEAYAAGNDFAMYGRDGGTRCDSYTKRQLGMVLVCEQFSDDNRKAIFAFNKAVDKKARSGELTQQQVNTVTSSIVKDIEGCFLKAGAGGMGAVSFCAEKKLGLRKDAVQQTKPVQQAPKQAPQQAQPVQQAQPTMSKNEQSIIRWLTEMEQLGGVCVGAANHIRHLYHNFGPDAPVVTKGFDMAADKGCF